MYSKLHFTSLLENGAPGGTGYYHRPTCRDLINTIENHMLALSSTCFSRELLIIDRYNHDIPKCYAVLILWYINYFSSTSLLGAGPWCFMTYAPCSSFSSLSRRRTSVPTNDQKRPDDDAMICFEFEFCLVDQECYHLTQQRHMQKDQKRRHGLPVHWVSLLRPCPFFHTPVHVRVLPFLVDVRPLPQRLTPSNLGCQHMLAPPSYKTIPHLRSLHLASIFIQHGARLPLASQARVQTSPHHQSRLRNSTQNSQVKLSSRIPLSYPPSSLFPSMTN